MKFLLTFAFLLTSTAQAQFLQELCQSGERNLEYHLPYVTNGQQVWSESGKLLFETKEKYFALAVSRDSFWQLTREELIEKDLRGDILSRHTLPALSVLSWGKSLLTLQNQVIVLHEDGVSAFDVETQEFTWTHSFNDLTYTTTADIVSDGNELHVVMSATVAGGFLGVVTLNSEGKRVKALGYNVRRNGIIVSYAHAHWAQDRLIINNAGWLHSIDKNQLKGKKELVAKIVPATVQVAPNARRNISLKGDFFFDGKEIVGCGSYHTNLPGDTRIVQDLFRIKL